VVEGVNLFHDQETRLSKGCGLLTMATRPQAIAAMAALDETHVMEGAAAPLSVKWADTDLRARRNSRSPREDVPAAVPGDEAPGDCAVRRVGRRPRLRVHLRVARNPTRSPGAAATSRPPLAQPSHPARPLIGPPRASSSLRV
jgi:hypothetical protein